MFLPCQYQRAKYKDSGFLFCVLASLSAILKGDFSSAEHMLDSLFLSEDHYQRCLAHLIKGYAFLGQGQIQAANDELLLSSSLISSLEGIILQVKILNFKLPKS